MTGDSYLCAVLADGAAPFVYRSGVARLLGHVDDDLRLRFVAPVTAPSFPSLRLRIGRVQPPAVVTYRDNGHVPSGIAPESPVSVSDIPVPNNTAYSDDAAPPTPGRVRRTEPETRHPRRPPHSAEPPVVPPENEPPVPAPLDTIVVPPFSIPPKSTDSPSATAQSRREADQPTVAERAAAATTQQHTATPPPSDRTASPLDPLPPGPSRPQMPELGDTVRDAATIANVPASIPFVRLAPVHVTDEPARDVAPLGVTAPRRSTHRPRLAIDADDEGELDAGEPVADPLPFRPADVGPRRLDTAHWQPAPEEPAGMKPEPAAVWPSTMAADPMIIVDDAEPGAAPAFWARRHVGRLRPRLLR